MIINPTLAMGWNSVFKADVNHLAMSAIAVQAGGHASVDIRVALSNDGVKWAPQKVYGDLSAFTKSSGGPGAFELFGLLRVANAWWAYGAIWKSSGQNEGALFRSLDGWEWTRVLTGFESSGTVPSYRHFEYGDARGNVICLLKGTGQFVYSTDGGVSWAQRTDIVGYSTEFGASVAGRSVAITSSGIAVIGSTDATGGRVKTATTPSATFTDHGKPWGSKTPLLVVRGNIVLGFSVHNPSLGAVRAACAPEDNIAQSWADAGLAESLSVNRAFYALGRWYAGSNQGWRSSTGAAGVPGVGGWEAVTPPWSGAAALNSGYERDGMAFAHYGLGQLAVSEDGEAWDVIESSGLEPVRYLAAAA